MILTDFPIQFNVSADEYLCAWAHGLCTQYSNLEGSFFVQVQGSTRGMTATWFLHAVLGADLRATMIDRRYDLKQD